MTQLLMFVETVLAHADFFSKLMVTQHKIPMNSQLNELAMVNNHILKFYFNTDLDPDQPNDEKLKMDQSKMIKCLDSKCNSDKYDLGSSMTITISVFAFLLSLLL